MALQDLQTAIAIIIAYALTNTPRLIRILVQTCPGTSSSSPQPGNCADVRLKPLEAADEHT